MKRLAVIVAVALLAPVGASRVPGGATTERPKTPVVSLHLRDADVRDALRLVAKQGGINLVMSQGVEGAVTLELDQVSLLETLDAIAAVAALDYEIDGNIVTVATVEEVRAKKQEADLEAPPRDVLVIELEYVDAERMISVIEDILGEGGTVSLLNTSDHVAQGYESEGAEPTQPGAEAALQIGTQLSTSSQGTPALSHTLVVVDRPERLREVQRVVDEIDRKPVQVLIEARFVEVTLNEAQDLGVDWNVVMSAAGGAVPTTFPFGDSSLGSFNPEVVGGSNGVFPPAPNSVTTPGTAGLFTFGTLDFTTFAAVLQAIRTETEMEIVSNPHIVVGDRHTATILVGERYPILSANVSEFGSVTEQLERYEPIGVQLEVTPSVLNDDEVELYVRPSTSSLGALVSGSTGLSVARINSRQIDTAVRVKDQQTVVLGGLITSREVASTSRVPLLGSIPVLNKLFTHESTETERIDLVVFLTVAIVHEHGLTEAQRELFERTDYNAITDLSLRVAPRELAFGLTAPRF